jgi:hypothetical protein
LTDVSEELTAFIIREMMEAVHSSEASVKTAQLTTQKTAIFTLVVVKT